MKINIELPFFPGFYESDLENSDTAYWAIKEELEWFQDEYHCEDIDLDFNYEDYEEDVREHWVEGFREYKPEFVLSVENVEMASPKYYNFATDRLFADVELRDDWMVVMREFMTENAEWLRKQIKDDWTSYDGFCSFMSNNLDEWDKYLFEDMDERYISVMIGYMMYRANKNIRNDLVMIALDDIYPGSYVFLTDECKERAEACREEFEKKHDPNQLTIPFDYGD
jgi:hypothetical protein